MNRMIYHSPYYAVEETKDKELVVRDLMPESASVVAVHEGSVLLVRQYRDPVEAETWELPGGTIEPGEDIILAVQRELEEETGVRVGEIVSVGSAYPVASLANRKVHFYFTEDVKKIGKPHPDKEEEVVPEWVPLRELGRMIRDGSTDSMLGHGLLLCGLHGLLDWD